MAGPNSSIIKWLQMLILTKPGFLGDLRRPCTNQSRKEYGEGSSPLTQYVEHCRYTFSRQGDGVRF
jgi:hypothetical protein